MGCSESRAGPPQKPKRDAEPTAAAPVAAGPEESEGSPQESQRNGRASVFGKRGGLAEMKRQMDNSPCPSDDKSFNSARQRASIGRSSMQGRPCYVYYDEVDNCCSKNTVDLEYGAASSAAGPPSTGHVSTDDWGDTADSADNDQ